MRRRASTGPVQRGFTLIELMIAVAVVAILTSIALPAYTSYIKRSRVPEALNGLTSVATRLEQYFQDNGNYGPTACGVTMPTAANFTLTCALANSQKEFTVTATGTGTMVGYTYTINFSGTRKTTAHPLGTPTSDCWSIRGKTCDA